ncbi:hypothetical protein Tco_0047334, partial [Tanacetum coccineum]
MGDTIAQIRFENVSKTSNDSLLAGVNTPRSDEDSEKLKELMEFCTKLQQRVLDLENTKTAQAQKITSLKLRVKKRMHPNKSRIAYIDADAGINLDKGKAKMVEPEKPIKKKELIRLDEEIASKLQAEFNEEVRLAREKAEKEKEANIVLWDNVQAMIDADYQIAQQMQAKEQEKLSIEEKFKLFVQLLEARKKHFAVMRAQEKRNKPPTKAQKRKTMSTYLKNMAGYKHNQLKNKSFDDIQKLFDKAMKRVNTFVDMDKEAGEYLQQESTKKQKVDEDRETAKLQSLMEVILEEEVSIDAIPLATKPASIVDWKIHKEGKKSYYQIIRADG